VAGVAAGVALMVGGVWVAHATREAPPSGAPETGWVRSIPGPVQAVAAGAGGSSLYAGARQGLYRSGDGRSWQKVFAPGFWAKPVAAIGTDRPGGSRLWAAAGSQIYLSSDGGRSWRPGFRSPAPILSVAAAPGRSSSLLVGTSEGLYQSRDGGLSGVRVSGIPGRASFREVLFDPEQPARCFALSGRGLFRSEDGGKSWSRQNGLPLSGSGGAEEEVESEEGLSPEEDLPPTGGEGMPPRMAADLSRRLLWVSTEQGIFQSGDGGHEWKLLPSSGFARGSGPADRLLVHPAWPGSLFALKDSKVYVYRPNRQEWLRVGNLPEKRVYDAQWADEGSSLWVGTEAGLFRIALKAPEAVPELPKPLEGTTSSAEPSIQQVHRMTIAYAELSPGKIRNWRALARLRAFVPSFSVGLNQDRDANIVSSTTAGVTKFSVGPDRRTRRLDFGFSWDLGDFIWSPDQTSIDVRSRLTTQLRQDLLEEATRLYFERRRLQAEFAAQPSEDAALRKERDLRLAELTAYLDALTGGGFSRVPD